jgi:hypothetical protein
VSTIEATKSRSGSGFSFVGAYRRRAFPGPAIERVRVLGSPHDPRRPDVRPSEPQRFARPGSRPVARASGMSLFRLRPRLFAQPGGAVALRAFPTHFRAFSRFCTSTSRGRVMRGLRSPATMALNQPRGLGKSPFLRQRPPALTNAGRPGRASNPRAGRARVAASYAVGERTGRAGDAGCTLALCSDPSFWPS